MFIGTRARGGCLPIVARFRPISFDVCRFLGGEFWLLRPTSLLNTPKEWTTGLVISQADFERAYDSVSHMSVMRTCSAKVCQMLLSPPSMHATYYLEAM